MENPKVFISYAREDVKEARSIYKSLNDAGAKVWMDEVDLLPGQNWKNEISNAISECRYFLALISSNSIGKRGFVQKELKQALDVLDEFPESEVFVIPIRLDDAEPSYSKLKDIHRVDLFPNWNSGISKILLTMDLNGVAIQESIEGRFLSVSSEWLEEGLQLRSDKLVIPPNETAELFNLWFEWFPKFIEQESTSSSDPRDTLEKAFILATIKSIYGVYEAIPDEDEMKRGSSVLSRKCDLFYSFSKEAYIKAKERNIDLQEYIFPDRTKSVDTTGELGADDQRGFLRLMLQQYIMRACDVNLEEVERFEEVMRNFPAWEPLVESVYDIDEMAARKAYSALEKKLPDASEDEIVGSIAFFYIDRCLVEEIPFLEEA